MNSSNRSASSRRQPNSCGFSQPLTVSKAGAQIDEKRVAADARYVGKYVLRTTTDLPSAEVVTA